MLQLFEYQIRPLMMFLAYWIYSNESQEVGVTEIKLIQKSKEYLMLKLYEDTDEAENASMEFVKFCKGRAWVFTDIGILKDGMILSLSSVLCM